MAKKENVEKQNKETLVKSNSSNRTEKVGAFLSKNRIPLIVVVLAVIVGVISYTVIDKIFTKNVLAGLDQIEKAEYVLMNNNSELSESDIVAKYDAALEAVEKYTLSGGIVGARANYFKAEIYAKKANFEKARDSYILAASKVKNTYLSSICYFNAAVACEELNDNQKALEYYQIALDDKDFPDPTHALFSIGRIKEVLLDYIGAKDAYEKILAKDNVNDPWANLAKSRLLTMQIEGKI